VLSLVTSSVENGGKKENDDYVALKGFFRLMQLWGIRRADQGVLLGGASRKTLNEWERALAAGKCPHLSSDQFERISYLLGIHEATRILYKEKQHAYGWITRPHKKLGGLSPLEWVVGHKSIMALQSMRYYVDDLKGGVAT